MDYILSFLEGIITFISPCFLPLLPVYISWFSGDSNNFRDVASNRGGANKKIITSDNISIRVGTDSEGAGDNSSRGAGNSSDNNLDGKDSSSSRASALLNAIFFIAGFTLVFTALGAFAGSIGSLFVRYRTILNMVTGGLIILFGLSFLGLFNMPFRSSGIMSTIGHMRKGVFSSFVFGIIFSLSWSPCIGAFLGSALMHAASEGGSLKGILMLLAYSAGLGIPFVVCTLLIDNLKTSFGFIKKHYRIINNISGLVLIILGLVIATGNIGYLVKGYIGPISESVLRSDIELIK